MFPFRRKIAVSIVPLLWLAACASAPSDNSGKTPGGPPPAWTGQPARTSENGYIIYVGTGEDATVERAHFKASGMAVQDLVNECSLPPKGTRTEDSYELKDEATRTYKAWVKISIQFEDCEDGKKAVDPDDIRRLANSQLSEELKRYQHLIDEPEPEALADTEGLNPAVNNTNTTPVSSGGTRVVLVRDTGSFFWARQQLAFSKQVVILAPPQQFASGSPQATAFIRQVQPAQTSVQHYEAQNPEVKSWHAAYSASPERQQRFQDRAPSRPVARTQGFNNRSQGSQNKAPRSSEKPRRRRRHGRY